MNAKPHMKMPECQVVMPGADATPGSRPPRPHAGLEEHTHRGSGGADPGQPGRRSGGAYLLRLLTEQEALVKLELGEDTADGGDGAVVGGTVVQPPALQQLGLPRHVLREGVVAQPAGSRASVSPSRGVSRPHGRPHLLGLQQAGWAAAQPEGQEGLYQAGPELTLGKQHAGTVRAWRGGSGGGRGGCHTQEPGLAWPAAASHREHGAVRTRPPHIYAAASCSTGPRKPEQLPPSPRGEKPAGPCY